jgi:nicotinamidase-related amidase
VITPVSANPFSFELVRSHAALLIIDMQRDFVEPGGFGETLGNQVEPLQAIIPTVANVLDRWRSIGAPVFHTRESHLADLSDCPPTKLHRGAPKLRIGDAGPMGRILIRGEPGNQIVAQLTQWIQFAGPIRRIESIGSLGPLQRKLILITQGGQAIWRGELPLHGKDS